MSAQVVCTDTAEHEYKAAMTAVVPEEHGAVKNSCSIIGIISQKRQKKWSSP